MEIAWHYARRATDADRRRTRHVLAQFVPALVAGFLASLALLRLNPGLAAILPGLWALLFGVGIFSARPFLPRSAGFVATYYWVAGLALLWASPDIHTIAPWMVGGVFGAGQLIGALVLHREERGMK
jgi:hypothetical protein